MAQITRTQHFKSLDSTTWPPLDTPVLWIYNCGDSRKYMVASLFHETGINKGEYLHFEVVGIDGYEWDCDLDIYTPFAWQHIPEFDLPPETTNAN